MKCAFKPKALSGAKVGQQAVNAPWESGLWDRDQCSKRMVTKEIWDLQGEHDKHVCQLETRLCDWASSLQNNAVHCSFTAAW